jgi:hypothetical protein
MFAKLLIAAITLPALLVWADPNPNVPGPGDSYKEGGNCLIQWDADTTGKWTNMQIELKTGDNYNMVPLMPVTTIDGTKQTQFVWTCPKVSPNSAIYFYEFSTTSSPTKYWTTRFTITDPNGNSVPPLQTTQPNGDKIPWGNGTVVDASNSLPASSSSGLSSLPSSSSSGLPGSSSRISSSHSSSHSSSTGSPVPTQTGGNTSSSQSNSNANGDMVLAVPKVIAFVVGLVATSTAFFL